MYKAQVEVPAVITNLGVGLNMLGVSLNLHAHIEMVVRQDGELVINFEGEGKDHVRTDFQNPVLKAAIKVFQAREMAPAGLQIDIVNNIPFGVGMDAEAALLMGGLVAANNFVSPDYSREGIITLARQLGLSQIAAVSTMMGGLNLCFTSEEDEQIYDSLEPPPLRLAVIVPTIPDYQEKVKNSIPDTVGLHDAIYNLSRLPFMINALMDGDYQMLNRTLRDKLYMDAHIQHITGYEQAIDAAYEHGAAAVTLASFGPAIVVFAPYNHRLIGDAMIEAFAVAGVDECRLWTPSLDAQGITVSVAS